MRRTLVAAVAVFTAVAMGGCGRTAAPAARVNGETVSQDQLWNTVALQKRLTETSGGTSSSVLVAGDLDSSYKTQGISDVLGGLVVNAIVRQEVDRLGLVVDDAAVDNIRAQIEQSSQDAQILQELSQADQDVLLRRFAAIAVLQEYASDPTHLAEPDDDMVRTFFDQDPEQFRTVCARILFTTGEPQADSARARIAAGESFETVTRDMSVDPQQSKGGTVQCVAQRSLPPELADALSRVTPGTLLAPVKTADGYFVVLYVQMREPSLETARELVAEQMSSDPRAKLQLILQRAVRAADVSVNPEFGLWTGDLQNPVVPRPAPASTGEEGQGQSAQDRSRREELMRRLPQDFLAQLAPAQRSRLDQMSLDQLEALVNQVEQSRLGVDAPSDSGGTEVPQAVPGG